MIFKHFGREILHNILSDILNKEDITSDFIDICYNKVYKDFLEHIDGIDNGVTVGDGQLRYHISTTLSNRVGHLNPSWNEPQTTEIMNERFREAVLLTGGEFISHVESLAKSWWPARSIVLKALEERFSVHSSGSIIILSQACPWKDHLFDIEDVFINIYTDI